MEIYSRPGWVKEDYGEFLNVSGKRAFANAADKAEYDRITNHGDHPGSGEGSLILGLDNPGHRDYYSQSTEFPAYKKEQRGKYSANNSMLTALSPEGILAGFDTPENRKALVSAGYLQGELPVIGTETVFEDPEFNQKFQDLLKKGRDQREEKLATMKE